MFLVLELLRVCARAQTVPGGRRLLCHPALPSSPTSEPCTSSCSTSTSSLQHRLTETSSSSCRCFPTASPASLRPSHHQPWHPSEQPVARISPTSLAAVAFACEDHPRCRDAKMGTIPLFFCPPLPPSRPQKPRHCGSSSSSSRKASFSSSSLHHAASLSQSLSLSSAAVLLT